jgi:ABC-type nitrate/sulfonate/bicarbonate transport system permease component
MRSLIEIGRFRTATQSKCLRLLARYIPLALVLFLWQTLVDLHLVNRAFLPSFTDALHALLQITRSGELAINLLVSTYRALGGLLVGCLLGAFIGMTMATSKAADQFLGPLVATTYSLPKTSLIALFILWFGIGDVTNIITVALACLLPVIVSTYHGVKAIPAVLLWSARAMNTASSTMKWRILLPGAMPSIFTGVRIALGFCFVLTISAEMIAAKVGIGKLIFFYGENGAYAYMFGGLLVVIVLAYVLDRILIALMHYVLRWHDSISAASGNE